MLFLTKYESNLIVHDLCSHPITMVGGEVGGRGKGSLYVKLPTFCSDKIFSYICSRVNLLELKTNGDE